DIGGVVEPRIDPMRLICPFEMQGRCNDVTCPFQHLDSESAGFGGGSSSNEGQQRALRRNMVKRTQPWLVYKTQMHGPAPPRLDEGKAHLNSFTSSFPQP